MTKKGTIRLPLTADKLPTEPGVYFWKDARRRLLYVGKAGNLRRRVMSYLRSDLEPRIAQMVSEAASLEYVTTGSVIEALLFEARMIKELQPVYNIRDKDDKSFYEIEITDEEFPRVMLVRGTDAVQGERFGPFTSGYAAKTALQIIRRLFPFNTHSPAEVGKSKRPCVQYEIGLCPGTCAGLVSRSEYRKTVRIIRRFFEGKKERIVRQLTRDMHAASRAEEYERAAELKRRVFALQHINDVALLSESAEKESNMTGSRIEGYDISHISGEAAVGSMVVLYGDEPSKADYRRFRIKSVEGVNDTAMLREVLSRRLGNSWPLPRVFLIDGGVGQVNAAKAVLADVGVEIPVVGLAKGADRAGNELIGELPEGVTRAMLVRARDEAHRFAVAYHRKLRKM